MPTPALYIGLMSGTSLDGIDAVLMSFSEGKPRLLAHDSTAIPEPLRQQVLQLNTPGMNEIELLADLDPALGKLFAQACINLMSQNNIHPSQIRAIGSHGQTIRHRPHKAYTLQIGDPNIIAERTGVTTIADFRRRDMAAGGQGAPLVPAFHKECFHSTINDRVIINIGGMANITLLPSSDEFPVIGYDTGPGNVLMDAWVQSQTGEPYDKSGAWASSGSVNTELLNRLLSEEFFKLPYPKSTGRELFNLHWVTENLHQVMPAKDVQATLSQLTATSIAQAIQSHGLVKPEVYVCGGGSHNIDLLQRLTEALNTQVLSTQQIGLNPDWVEGSAFAWLAYRTLEHQTGNLPEVTGATERRILGGIYLA